MVGVQITAAQGLLRRHLSAKRQPGLGSWHATPSATKYSILPTDDGAGEHGGGGGGSGGGHKGEAVVVVAARSSPTRP